MCVVSKLSLTINAHSTSDHRRVQQLGVIVSPFLLCNRCEAQADDSKVSPAKCSKDGA